MTLGKNIIQWLQESLKVLLLLMCVVHTVDAQDIGEVQSETIVIEKEKKLTLPPANREFEKISDPQAQPAPANSKYQVQEIGIVLPRFETKVKVPTTKTDEPVEIHNHYIKAGFGNYVTPYLEAFAHTGKKKNYALGARVKHLSSLNGPYKGVKNSLNEIDLQGKYWLGNQWVAASALASRERYTWYGVQNRDNIDWDRDSLKHIFTRLGAELTTGNMGKGRLSYQLGGKYFYQSNNQKNKESDLNALLSIKYQKDKDALISGDVFFNQNAYSIDTSTFSRILAGFTGKYTMTKDKLKGTVGLNYTYSGDTLEGSAGSHIYPLIDLTYDLIPHKLLVEGGLKGGMERNTWMSFTAQNPYLDPSAVLAHTNNKMNVYLNLRGHVSQKINVKAGGAYLLYKNLWHMTNGPDSSRFVVLYDNENTSAFNLNGELTYDASPFRTGLKADYYSYQVSSNMRRPWHRPSFVGTFFAAYTIYKKIVLKTDIYYISGISAINLATNREVNLKEIVDVNLKAEYRFSDQFSTFVEANNLLSSKYERYMYYQSRGINLLVGLTYRF